MPGLPRRSRDLTPLLRIAGPVAVANLAQIVVLVTDSVLLGRSDVADLAGAAVAVPVYLVALIILRSWATAVQILVARAEGAGRHDERDDLVRVALVAAVVTGGVLAVLVSSLRGPIAGLIAAGSTAADLGSRYLAILPWALPALGAVLVLQAFLNGTGRARHTLVSNAVIGSVNLVAGLVLVSALGLGVTGAGWATVVSSVVGLVHVLLGTPSRAVLTALPGDRARHLAALWRLAWPETTLYLVGYVNEVVVVAFVSRTGEVDLAGYRLLDTVTTVLYALLTAASTAVTVVLGQDAGAGRAPSTGPVVRAGIGVAALLAAPVGFAVAVLPNTMLSLVTSSPEIADAAAAGAPTAVLSMLPLVAVLCLGGALRALRRNVWLMVASVIADVVALVPLAWVLGVRLELGLSGFYLAWLAFGLLNLLLVAARFRSLARSAVS